MYMHLQTGRGVAAWVSGALCALSVACGGTVDTPPDPSSPPGASSGGASSGGAGASSSGGTSSGGSSGAVETGPFVEIWMRGSKTPVSHADGFSGQTPLGETVAVKKLELLRSEGDPAPLLVFDLGGAPAEADLTNGVAAQLAKVPARSLTRGTYRWARVALSYVRYSVAATMHSGVMAPVPGQYDNVQALSDGAPIDGVARKKGFYRYSFVVGGVTYGTLEGADAPVPAVATSGGIRMDASGPETFYVFPVTLIVDPDVKRDVRVDFDANVFESFRWADAPTAGYAAGVFDTTPSTFETVMAFGASAFDLRVTP